MTMRSVDALERGRVAARALDALGPNLAQRQIFVVECEQGHHLATVYQTSVGSVFVSRTEPGPRIPGQSVEYGLPSLGSGEHEFIDLLWAHPSLGDDLAASCECGSYTLSRSRLIDHVDLGMPSVRIA